MANFLKLGDSRLLGSFGGGGVTNLSLTYNPPNENIPFIRPTKPDPRNPGFKNGERHSSALAAAETPDADSLRDDLPEEQHRRDRHHDVHHVPHQLVEEQGQGLQAGAGRDGTSSRRGEPEDFFACATNPNGAG